MQGDGKWYCLSLSLFLHELFYWIQQLEANDNAAFCFLYAKRDTLN